MRVRRAIAMRVHTSARACQYKLIGFAACAMALLALSHDGLEVCGLLYSDGACRGDATRKSYARRSHRRLSPNCPRSRGRAGPRSCRKNPVMDSARVLIQKSLLLCGVRARTTFKPRRSAREVEAHARVGVALSQRGCHAYEPARPPLVRI
jgi:hypothetical protein